jgi:Antibiotic biosynthesis monooxygenase
MATFILDFDEHPAARFRIDNFSVPTAARADFEAAMRRNLAFIETLPGFLWHLAFEKTAGPSNFDIVTVAVWESQEAIEKAIVAVRQYYARIGFDPGEAIKQWGAAAEIGQYQVLPEFIGRTPRGRAR